jgi:antitoxin HicB
MKNRKISNEKKAYRINVYPVDIETDEMEWVAEIPDLPGCIGCGNTVEEAIKMVKEAKGAWLEIALQEERKIPEPTNPYDNEYSGKFTLRIPKGLHKELSIKAQEEGVSLNQYLLYILSKGSKDSVEKKYKYKATYELEIKHADIVKTLVEDKTSLIEGLKMEVPDKILETNRRF